MADHDVGTEVHTFKRFETIICNKMGFFLLLFFHLHFFNSNRIYSTTKGSLHLCISWWFWFESYFDLLLYSYAYASSIGTTLYMTDVCNVLYKITSFCYNRLSNMAVNDEFNFLIARKTTKTFSTTWQIKNKRCRNEFKWFPSKIIFHQIR